MENPPGSSVAHPPSSLLSLCDKLTLKILATILCVCDQDHLQDLYHTVRTCRRLYKVFRKNRPYLLTLLGLDSIPHFRLALAAVRATHTVETALRRNVTPGSHTITQAANSLLRAHRSRIWPSLWEFSAVISLNRFTDAAGSILIGDMKNPALWLSHQKHALSEWVCRFHLTMYRLIIAAAALSGHYLQPFVQTKIPKPPGFLERILNSNLMYVEHEPSETDFDAYRPCYQPCPQDISYFSRFALYDYLHGSASSSTKYAEVIFKIVADWLLDDMDHEELRARERGLSPGMVQALTSRPHPEGSRVPNFQSQQNVELIDSIPRWPIHCQIQQLIRVVEGLSSLVVTDKWGRGVLVPELSLGPPAEARPGDGGVSGEVPEVEVHEYPQLTRADIRIARIVRYGLFRPEDIVVHLQKDLLSCSAQGRKIMSSFAEDEKGKRHAIPSQPIPSISETLFGGTPGRVLKLERIFFSLMRVNFAGGEMLPVPATHIHPGLLTYMKTLPEAHAVPDDEYRITPWEEWDDFWGDNLNVIYHAYLSVEPPATRGDSNPFQKYMDNKRERKNRDNFEGNPGSYIIL